MAFDGIVMSALCHELNTQIVGGRISKISQPEKDELLITIKNNSNNYRLLISAGASLPLMYLTEDNKPAPKTAPAFCMLLRKYIGSAKILDIKQSSIERILCIYMEHMDELGDYCKKKMYIELMGKYSNIIFTDDEDNIIDSIKRISAQVSSLREVLPGRKYFLPDELKKADPLEENEGDFIEGLKHCSDTIVKYIYIHYSGISPLIASEICHNASIDGDKSSDTLSDDECLHLYKTFYYFFDDIKQHNYEPNIIYKNQVPIDFSAVKLNIYKSDMYESKDYSSMSELLATYYTLKDLNTRIRQKSVDLRKITQTALERAVKKYELQKKQLKDCEGKDKYKIYGDLLNTYGYELKGGEKSLTCENYYDDNKTITIPLDDTKNGNQNAKRYYDKYAKAKRTEDALSVEIQNTNQDIEHLSSIMSSLDMATEESDLNQIRDELIRFGYIKKHTQDKKAKLISAPLHFVSSEGFDIYVGKNNYQNEEVTFKIASANDWWFHAKGIPGSHVIVKTDGKEMTDKVYEEAAALAAYYSKGRDNSKVDIDYVQRREVKKVAGAAPGFVVYHTNWSMTIAPASETVLFNK